jgi:hypothetical protein
MTLQRNDRPHQGCVRPAGRHDGRHRRLALEAIEPRLLLSAVLQPSLGAAPSAPLQPPALVATPGTQPAAAGARGDGLIDITDTADVSGALAFTADDATFAVVINNCSTVTFSSGVTPAHPGATGNSDKPIGPLVPALISKDSPCGETSASSPAGEGITRGDEPHAQAVQPPWARIAQDEPQAGSPAEGLIDPTPRLNDPVRLLAAADVRAAPPPGPAAPTGVPPANGQAATPLDGIDGARGRSQAFDLALEQRGPDLGLSAATENVLAMACASPDEMPRSAEGAGFLGLAMAEDSAGTDGNRALPPSSAEGVPPAVSVVSQRVVSNQVGGISWAALLREARLDSDRSRAMLSVVAVGAVSWELTEKQLRKDRLPAAHGAGWKDPLKASPG